jgi:tripartite motif-containing protein 2/3/tripartite motif-containing protein 71
MGDAEGELADPRGLCVDRSGRLLFPDGGADRISIWSTDLTYSASIGTTGQASGQLAQPNDVFVDDNDFIYVADTLNHRIQKFSPDGMVCLEVRDLSEHGRLDRPVAIAVDGAGRIYVGDAHRNLVVVLSSSGRALKVIPSPHSDAALDAPGDVRIDASSNVYVSDRGGRRVRRFDTSANVTGVIELEVGDDMPFEGGDIDLLDGAVLLPDRLNNQLSCYAFEELDAEVVS